MEAMASGTPVVATDVDGIPEIVENGRTGFLVPPADAQSLAKAIEALLSNDKMRREMGAEAKKEAAKKFAIDVMADKIEAVYWSVMKN